MGDSDETPKTTWDGYSDYESVSERIARSIHDAIDAYATVERAHKERAALAPEIAARAGGDILTAAINVQTELATYSEENEEYGELVEKFRGDDGYVQRLRDTELRTECPDWLYEFVADIRLAGFKLGYLKAGREEKEREDDSPEANAKEMFSNL